MLVVSVSYAGSNPRAMMVKDFDTIITMVAVVCPIWSNN